MLLPWLWLLRWLDLWLQLPHFLPVIPAVFCVLLLLPIGQQLPGILVWLSQLVRSVMHLVLPLLLGHRW